MMQPEEKPSPPKRTLSDVCRDRGPHFPRKSDLISNRRDREDFLIAIYAMIAGGNRDALSKLLLAGGHTRRMQMVGLFKGTGGQLGLTNMLKKVISFDTGGEVTVMGELQLYDILEEIQAKFEPEKARKISAPIAPRSQANGQPSFLGRTVTNAFLLATLNALEVEEPLQPEVTQPLPPPIPKQQPAPALAKPVPAQVARILRPSHPPHQHYYPPVRPFRGSFKSREEPRRPYIPPTPSNKPVHVAPPVITPPPTKIETPLPLPEFSDLSQTLSWLREQKKWDALYQEIKKGSLNEISLRALLQTRDPYLLRVLVRIQSSFSCPTIKGIIHDVLQPLPAQTAPVPVTPVPEVTPLPPEPSPELKLSPEHETEIKRIFSFHKAGKYSEFWNAVQGLVDTETLSEIRQAQEVLKQKDLFRTIAFIAGHELTEKDVEPYRTHTWNHRIAVLPHVRAQGERLLAHSAKNTMPVIKELLGSIDIKIPVITSKDQEWMGFDEIDAPKSTLLAAIQSLIKLDREDPESTKKILRKLKQILGISV